MFDKQPVFIDISFDEADFRALLSQYSQPIVSGSETSAGPRHANLCPFTMSVGCMLVCSDSSAIFDTSAADVVPSPSLSS